MNWYEDLYNRQTYLDIYAVEDTRIAPREVDGLIRLLNLNPGQSVLDVCCGYGRHAVLLAKWGLRVTAIDLSSKQIEEATVRASREGVAVDFLVGDAREMSFQGGFDAVLNLFTSFGLFQDEADNLRLLERMAGALAPGGPLLVDLWNREKLIRDFTPLTIEERQDGIRIERSWTFDAWRGRVYWQNRIAFPDGRQESWSQSVRAYTLIELRTYLSEVGLLTEQIFGGFDGSEYTLDSPRMITTARKPSG